MRRVSHFLGCLALGCASAPAPIDGGNDAASMVIDGGADASAALDGGLDAPAPSDESRSIDAGPPDAILSYVTLDVPDGGAIGADDITFGHRIGRVLLPTSEALQLYDPTSRALSVVHGFGASIGFDAGTPHGVAGTTSADDGAGVAFAIDRRSQMLAVVDTTALAITFWTPLASQPDIVRTVSASNEIWVTEPTAVQIEVFSISASAAPAHAAFVSTPLGCEALAIDAPNGRAYTNSGASTLGIDTSSHAIATTWPNGCAHAHGLVVDPRGLLVVDCNEGHLQVLDAAHAGAQLSQLTIPVGTDLIDLDPSLGHVYVAAPDGSLSVASLDASGTLALLGTLAEGTTARAVASDGAGHVYLIDAPTHRLAVVSDPWPSSL